LYSHTYRKKYLDFLKIEFPVITNIGSSLTF
ncbi:unnamed protein product, partial [marine sediment metagenome]